MATKLEISELDFDGIKANLKTFLSQQDEFTDYNFEGSGMSVLLDTLAYNTHYLAYNANMLANEMYLDSADLRSSVVSLAKQVGYTPTSCTSSSAVLDVLVNSASGASLTMSRGTKFTTTVDGQSYSFVNNADVSISPTSGVYQFNNLTVNEGSYLNYKYLKEFHLKVDYEQYSTKLNLSGSQFQMEFLLKVGYTLNVKKLNW